MTLALADHQGSVRMLLDNDGNVVNQITYDAFGNITVESNPDVNFRFSYTGRELDSETGLYNYRSRYYDPESGEFVSEDTIGFAGGDGNLYRYVINSPVNYTDPTGEFIPLAVAAVIVFAAVLSDGLAPDGANAPTAPRDSEGNRLESGDPRLNPHACSSEPVNFDQPKNLDQSLKRAGVEVVLSAGLSNAGKAPNLAKSLLNSADDLTNTLAKNLGDIPVLVDGIYDDLAKQADQVDNLLADGLSNLKDVAPGLGAAADDLFKPFFESIWSSTSKESSVENAFGHWQKHKKEFPDLENSKKYVEAAQELLDNPPSGALTKTRTNGEKVVYDPATDKFAVSLPTGEPKTMFKPDPNKHGYSSNVDYFNAQ